MKVEISKERWMELARLEEGHEPIWKLVMAMKLNGFPKGAINQGFMTDFEIKHFEEYWARSYAELCKGSALHD